MKYLILLISFAVMADDYKVINNYSTEVYTDDVSKAIALSLSFNHPLDFDTKKWQLSINSGHYNNQSAASISVGKRFNGMDALLHSAYGQDNGKHAVTIGGVWRF